MPNRTAQTLQLLRRFESRNLLFVDPDGSWPIVWERARGVQVWDVEGKKYLDLTAAFGVAAAGHANPRVVRAAQRQMARLLHAMGDVHPHPKKAELARVLSRITFERWTRPKPGAQPARPGHPSRRPSTGKTIFCNSGFEAVEAALKTAFLATGKPGVIAFTGAYHGLGYGALNATHRHEFRSPFRAQLGRFGHFLPFPIMDVLPGPGQVSEKGGAAEALAPLAEGLRRCFRRYRVGAVLAEPVQGRGGIRVPPPAFLPLLRSVCDQENALLILDEIYTGLGRTGRWFACEHAGVVPDLICLGKALTGGFPLSACVGRAELMDRAWPESTGEAIHTSTFLGHPVGCAMALAQNREIASRQLVRRSAHTGDWLLNALAGLARRRADLLRPPRGLGLMIGLEFTARHGATPGSTVQRVIKAMLKRGFILLPEGDCGQVLSFTPPLTVTRRPLQSMLRHLEQVLTELSGP